MLTDDQAQELSERVYRKVQSLRVTATTRAYARDLAGLIVDEWQREGSVPMGDFGVEVTLSPWSLHVDYLPGHGPARVAS